MFCIRGKRQHSQMHTAMRALLGITSIAMLWSSGAGAQRVADLTVGTKIRLQTVAGARYEGALAASVDSSVQLVSLAAIDKHGARMLSDRVQIVPKNDVASAEFLAGKSHRGGMLAMGAKAGAIGIIAGAIIGAVVYEPCESQAVLGCILEPSSRSQSAGVGAVVIGVPSMLVGAVVGAVRGRDIWEKLSMK